jgi:hypothetical protein
MCPSYQRLGDCRSMAMGTMLRLANSKRFASASRHYEFRHRPCRGSRIRSPNRRQRVSSCVAGWFDASNQHGWPVAKIIAQAPIAVAMMSRAVGAVLCHLAVAAAEGRAGVLPGKPAAKLAWRRTAMPTHWRSAGPEVPH